jgi:hypothetical protein
MLTKCCAGSAVRNQGSSGLGGNWCKLMVLLENISVDPHRGYRAGSLRVNLAWRRSAEFCACHNPLLRPRRHVFF